MARIAAVACFGLTATLVACGGGDASAPTATMPAIEARATDTPVEPSPVATATFPPAPITPSAIDTSDWETYESPAGFSIRYPPTWRAFLDDARGAELTSVWILNEARQQQTAIEGGASGEAWVEITPRNFPEFDPAISYCDSAETGLVTFAGRRAVRCWSAEPEVYTGLPAEAEAYMVDQGNSGVISVITYAIDTDEETSALLRTILSTFAFDEAP